MVAGLQEVHRSRFEESNVEVLWGRGVFVGEKSIEVVTTEGKRVVSADTIVISTGSQARIENIPGLKEAKPLTHIEIMELDIVPEHLIILGGGYISLEFVKAMRRFWGGRMGIGWVLKGEEVGFYTSAVVEVVSGFLEIR
jgi:pyruvate/2-oxoglutarate dehydrogenase complex dihydrolipoamide dehydrogenase (E3) component